MLGDLILTIQVFYFTQYLPLIYLSIISHIDCSFLVLSAKSKIILQFCFFLKINMASLRHINFFSPTQKVCKGK